MGTDMDNNKYKKIFYIIIILYIICIIGTVVTVFILSGNTLITLVCIFGMIVPGILSYILHRADSIYIYGIIIKLSELMDVLLFIDEQEIFPSNEDTVLSKLQNKVIKLSRVLKNKNRLEEQEHENIKRLVSDISHQLKTPIANLKMYSSFLSDETLDTGKQREYIDIICMTVERLNFLSENIIKVSRLESGVINLHMQKQSLNETLLKAVKDIYVKAQKKKIEIQYDEKDKIELSHDRNWTAEAVFNLLDNAVKYGTKGNTIYLSIRRLGIFAEVSVRDENDIIPYEEHNNVFMRFYRGKNSNRQEGLGIGLYLSREIIVKQGGYIILRASESGNIFSVMLYIEKD